VLGKSYPTVLVIAKTCSADGSVEAKGVVGNAMALKQFSCQGNNFLTHSAKTRGLGVSFWAMTKRAKPWGYNQTPSTSSDRELHPDTVAVRGALQRTGFQETSEALFLNSGFTYDSAEQAEASFMETEDHYLYSRFGNPTVTMFEERLALIEGAEAAHATGSGMSAMFASVACLVSAGDRVVASGAMFSSCYVVLTEILPKWGVLVDVVGENTPEAWERALSKPAKAVFIETPSNPLMEIVDIAMVAELSHKAGALLIVDNVMASPVLQKPLELGADVIMYSATKHIDGQGRVLGGAVLGTKHYIDTQLKPFTRHTGPSMSPFNAWVLLKSLETMSMRVNKMADSAFAVAQALDGLAGVKAVHHPFLDSHPSQALAKRQMLKGGTTLALELESKAAAFKLMNALQVIDISNNLGDSRSLITHPASSTHRRLDADTQAKMGITAGTMRLSVGLEDPRDLIEDLKLALKA
jgi:O-succinylhomoserine sulfhydrylase